MGICLYFATVEAVVPEVEEAIRRDRPQSAQQPWVLCEPPHFYPTEEDRRLRGASKLNLHPWADELRDASEVPAERNDLQELLRRLCAWSAEYGLTWELEVEGMPLGRIEGGFCQGDVEAALEAFADLAEYLGEDLPHEWPQQGPEDLPGGPGLRIWREPD
jgi:hypothetical protein